jgi:REP element-mobilizing transposase RayT
MARPLRIEFENAFYHVMNRGTERRATYTKDVHREMFLNLLGESAEMFGIQIHAYCLMGNHYHLLLSTPNANLSRTMRHIDGVYTQRFNRLERRDGPLFRGRYKSIVVDADEYLVAVSRYIHRNPLEASLVHSAADYTWSSFPGYLDESIRPKWLTTSEVLKRMGLNNPKDGAAYRSFVENPSCASLTEYYNAGRLSPILGGKAFRTLVLSRAQRASDPEISHRRSNASSPSMKFIIARAVEILGGSPDKLLQSKRGQTNVRRDILMHIARRRFGHSLKDIATAFECASYSVVGSAIHKIEKQFVNQPALLIQAKELEIELSKNRHLKT